MKNWITIAGVGVGLFTASVFGMLAVQGRLNHEGTRDIPILASLFEDPAEAAPPTIPNTPEPEPVQDPRIEPAGARTRDTRAMGGVFSFPVLDSGLTADDLEEMFRRAKSALDEADRQRRVLEAREADLRARERDLQDRELRIGELMQAVVDAREKLDDRIRQFRRDVHLVRVDEASALREYARTLGSFEPTHAATIVLAEWRGDEVGRARIAKVLAVMDPGDCDRILARVEEAAVRELLVERMRVVKAR